MIRLQKEAQLTGHKASIFALSPYQKSSDFLSAAGDGWIVAWDLLNPELGRVIAKVEGKVFSLCYLSDVHKVLAGDMNGGVHWIDLNNPRDSYHWVHHKKGTFGILSYNDDIFSIGGDGVLTRWNKKTGRSMESLQVSYEPLRSVAVDTGRDLLFVGSSDNSIYALRTEDLSVVFRVPDAHQNSVFTLHMHPDGQHLLSGARDAYLKVWRIENDDLDLVSAQPAHWYTLNSLAFHPSGAWFATGSRDRSVKVWDAKTFKLAQVLETTRDGGHINSVNKVMWSAYENTLISASDDRSLILWK
ncbi:MAG: PQQ-binding-like beta-propeller repeat protein [Saprospiraceae bacterium]|nr:PQQ-binding-like beta-propeller repeat protein [Saprospiraceae bacterium]